MNVFSAVVLIPVVIAVIYLSPRWPIVLMSAIFVIAGLALWEYLGLSDAIGAKTPKVVVIVLLAILLAVVFRGSRADGSGDWSDGAGAAGDLHVPLAAGAGAAGYGVFGFGLLYVGLPMSTLYLLSAQDNGPSLLLFLLLVVWAGDIAALYVGAGLGDGRWRNGSVQTEPGKARSRRWRRAWASPRCWYGWAGC